ncbi:MAG: hypothetical protein HYS78_02565 [Parcubacteria group bacterium]|nr:hypothetical protein [Parcubacteria group bacterium]
MGLRRITIGIGLIILGVLLLVLAAVLPAFAADIKDFPEADAYTAFNAKEDQRIWQRPGNLVLDAMSWPVTRTTISLYDTKTGLEDGFLTLTRTNPADGQSVTFYYNIKPIVVDDRAVLSFSMAGGMWQEGFLNIVPRPTKLPTDVFGALPPAAQLLFALPPLEGHLVKDGDGSYELSLIVGMPALSGLIKFSLKSVETFPNSMNGKTLKIWGAEVSGISSIKWAASGEKGKFEWQPGSGTTFEPKLIWG